MEAVLVEIRAGESSLSIQTTASDLPEVLRFLSKINLRQSSECWEWREGGSGGYGLFHSLVSGAPIGAHRFAWRTFNGPIPEGLQVLHKCDNRLCVNWKEHLFVGTVADNVQDMVQKGRAASGDKNGSRLHPERLSRGEKRYNAKLTNDKVRWIRAEALKARTHQAIADELGVNRGTVSAVIGGKIWKHVD